MLNISSFQPVAWPSATAHGIAPVSATPPVTPVGSGSRNLQTGLGQGQGQERSMPDGVRRNSVDAPSESVASDAAPLLPRESPDAAARRAAGEPGEAQTKAERDKADEQTEEKDLKQQLQDVLTSVWKASAAVVEVALGREGEAAATADTATVERTGAATAQVASAALSLPVASDQAANDAGLELATARSAQDVMAYDAHGNSSWTPLEAGSLLSRRV
ncbi:MAG: hypothetical protein C0443_02105 [Comamonadaceae bacterium]|nr:hypothetical protein [Comamonadaceae bacterium]